MTIIIIAICILIGGIIIGVNLNKNKPDPDTVSRQNQWSIDKDIDE